MYRFKSGTLYYHLLALPLFCACAGPTSPFGAIHKLIPVHKTNTNLALLTADNNKNYSVKFNPKTQFFHKEDSLRIKIKGKHKLPEIKNVRFIYNSVDLTQLFLKNSVQKTYPNELQVHVEFKNLKLSARKNHQIYFLYIDDIQHYAYEYKAPNCSIYKNQKVKGLHGFTTPNEYLNLINISAKEEKINASLIAGLVAMESGFNPYAVSSAKALGLTQITDIADSQITKKTLSWPRRDLASTSYEDIQEKIIDGELNDSLDWRLDPSLSIKGGANYLSYILSYWKLKPHAQILQKSGITSENQITDVVLASYNSGPDKIKKYIVKNRHIWLADPELKNVRYYINMIYSYCSDFSEDPK